MELRGLRADFTSKKQGKSDFLPPWSNSLTMYLVVLLLLMCLQKSLLLCLYIPYWVKLQLTLGFFNSIAACPGSGSVFLLGSPCPPLLPFYFLHLSSVMSSSFIHAGLLTWLLSLLRSGMEHPSALRRLSLRISIILVYLCISKSIFLGENCYHDA